MAMFGLRRPSRIEVPKSEDDVAMPKTPCGRRYLQRLGINTAGDAEKPAVDDLDHLPAPMGNGNATAENVIRQKFMRKLAYNKVWVPQVHSSPKHQCVIIFDWDDTILPTTWLREQDYHPGDCDEDDDCLQKIAQHSKSLLETAISAGHTYIITNASSGWAEYSAARWAPELLPVLRKVPVISARDKFEAAFPQVRQWKIQAFLEVQRQLDATPITNLVALGDADYEIEAARIMGDEFEEGLVKTVKFRPQPGLGEHLQQVEIVDKNLERVVGSVRNLKVCLERKQA